MNRIAIFSHYSDINKISDYVIYFIEELKKFASKIIFVSDCIIESEEINKIKHLINHNIIIKHGEYDFGSYKRGFKYCKENNLLKDCNELIFVNDSCYAPIFPFAPMFEKMSNSNVDFWGVTANFNSYFSSSKHIQSYFMVFKPQVFLGAEFQRFIQNITQEKNKNLIVQKYEIGLTKLLINNGFNFDVYSQVSKSHYASHILYYKDLIKKDKVPFLKRSIPLLKANVFPIGFESFVQKNTPYDYNLIKKDMSNKQKINLRELLFFLYKYLIRKIIILSRCIINTIKK